MEADTPWWGPVTLDEAGCWSGRLGPFELWIETGGGEVLLATKRERDPMLSTRGRARTAHPPEDAEHLRYATDRAPIAIGPALADRAVVVRPESPLRLLPGGSATLLVSSPLWIQVTVGDPAQTLLDVPTYQPSDTWFGPSPRQGELCYASRTRARLRPGAEASWTARAHTELVIQNAGDDGLLVERVSVPMPRLSLYAGPGARLWTERLLVARHGAPALAQVTIEPGVPAALPEGQRVAGPRTQDTRNVFARAVNTLLG